MSSKLQHSTPIISCHYWTNSDRRLILSINFSSLSRLTGGRCPNSIRVACGDGAFYLKSCRKLKYSWLSLCFPGCYEAPAASIKSLTSPRCCFRDGGDAKSNAAHLPCASKDSAFCAPSSSFSTILDAFFPSVFRIFSSMASPDKHHHWNQRGEPSADISASRKRTINYSWWEDHRQSITQCMKSSTSRPKSAPLVMHHPDTSPPPAVVSGLWRPSFLNRSNLTGLLKWCSLNWISQAWVTTAKVPHLLLCWITNGAGHPPGGDTAESVMTPWLVWALSPQPTWTVCLSLYPRSVLKCRQ